MSRHSVAEAQARLPELIARAAAGEEIVIAPEGGQTVALHPVEDKAPSTPPFPRGAQGAELVKWLEEVIVGRVIPGAPDAAELVRRMRDEDG